MAETLKFSLVSPERMLVEVDTAQAQIPGVEGELTALPGHAPFLTTLRPGLVRVATAEGVAEYFVTGGFAEIAPNETTVLAEEAFERELVKRPYVEEKLAEAEAALADAPAYRRIAAAQKVSDLKLAIDQLGL